MYSGLIMGSAHRVTDRVVKKDVVLFTALNVGYGQYCEDGEALEVLRCMLKQGGHLRGPARGGKGSSNGSENNPGKKERAERRTVAERLPGLRRRATRLRTRKDVERRGSDTLQLTTHCRAAVVSHRLQPEPS
ncbi:hypothetical protein Droror1_Dr00006409 [Drosera rotundifolia]